MKKNGNFLGQFTTGCSWIRPKSHIPRRRARKNEENVHLRFSIFETSSQRFLLNILRDFQKVWNYENWSFSRPIYHQIQSDMAENLYAMTTAMEKQKKCASQIFHFWNFITQIFAKHIERFSKDVKLWQIIFQEARSPSLTELVRQISPIKQRLRKKYYIPGQSARTDVRFSHLHFFSDLIFMYGFV